MSSKHDIQPYWRPDFKVQSTLPDIKVVRTDFLINFLAVALVMVVAFVLLQREYRAYSLRSSIASMEERVRVAEADDKLHLKESERFRESAKSVEELQAFFRAPFVAHEFLTEVSLLKPDELIFSRVKFSENVFTPKTKGKSKTKAKPQLAYNISIEGDVRGLDVLTEFKGALQAATSLNPDGFEVVVNESMQQRDAETGITPFKVSISLMPATAKPSTKGGNG